MERPLLRDIVFYLAAGFWAFYVYWKQEIRLYDSLGFLGLYVVYIVVVLVGRYIHNRTRHSLYLSSSEKLVQTSGNPYRIFEY
jgi:sodium/potassium/calcium exchanger 6